MWKNIFYSFHILFRALVMTNKNILMNFMNQLTFFEKYLNIKELNI